MLVCEFAATLVCDSYLAKALALLVCACEPSLLAVECNGCPLQISFEVLLQYQL